jgi:hypothetical protein
LLRHIRVGAQRHWRRGLQASLAAAGATWLGTELLGFVASDAQEWLKTQTILYGAILAALAFCSFIYVVYEPDSVTFTIPTTNTCLTICYGDLFKQDTDIIISVNEYFDGELGQVVAPESLHGQFIARYFSSNNAAFRAAVDPALALHLGEQVIRVNQPSIKYPIGTTLMLPIGQHKAFLVALSNTDLQTNKAYATLANFWVAVTNVLDSVHHLNNGRPLSLPLIGNGRSNLNLPPQHLLRLIVLAIVDKARKNQLPDNLRIVVPEACLEKIDLREIERAWRH